MIIEDSFPERFRNAAFHPTIFIYAWKRNTLDKLLEEVMQSNIAILGGEAWVASGELMQGVIPLKNGGKAVLNWKIKRQDGEEWYDFVERSVKETLTVIADTDLEKKVSAGIRNRLYYHFDFSEETV
jgi:hypothetical protein